MFCISKNNITFVPFVNACTILKRSTTTFFITKKRRLLEFLVQAGTINSRFFFGVNPSKPNFNTKNIVGTGQLIIYTNSQKIIFSHTFFFFSFFVGFFLFFFLILSLI